MGNPFLPFTLLPHWVRALQAPASGVCLAREKGWLLAWDRHHWLYLIDQAGHIQGQAHFPGKLVAAALAEDGSAALAVDREGLVHYLAPDFTTRWKKAFHASPSAAALEPMGQVIALADNKNKVSLLSAAGDLLSQADSARPIRFLAFVPNKPKVIACADFGLLGAIDDAGHWVWSDTPVTNVGDLSITGQDGSVLLACFSEGTHRYGGDGKHQGRIATAQPCRHVCQSYDGDRVAVAGVQNEIAILNRDGVELARLVHDQPITGLAMAPFGEVLYASTAAGIVKWAIKPL